MHSGKGRCSFCAQGDPKYTCPRCQRPYCCAACYSHASHDSCAQQFYQRNVEDTLKASYASSSSKSRVFDVLKRHASERLDDAATDGVDACSRFQDIDFDDDSEKVTRELLSRLTLQERREFENILASDGASGLMGEEADRKPWWQDFVSPLVLQVTDAPATHAFDEHLDLISRLPCLSAVTQRVPSPSIRFSLVNLSAAYCFVYRLFNCDFETLEQEFLEDLSDCCAVFKSAAVFPDVDTALQDCTQVLINERHISADGVRLLLEDVLQILRSRDAVLRMLADLIFACQSARSVEGKSVRLFRKKLEYLVAWTKEMGSELSSLVPEIQRKIPLPKDVLRQVIGN